MLVMSLLLVSTCFYSLGQVFFLINLPEKYSKILPDNRPEFPSYFQ